MSAYQLNFGIATRPDFPLESAVILGVFTIAATWLFYVTRPSPSQLLDHPGATRLRFYASLPYYHAASQAPVSASPPI